MCSGTCESAAGARTRAIRDIRIDASGHKRQGRRVICAPRGCGSRSRAARPRRCTPARHISARGRQASVQLSAAQREREPRRGPWVGRARRRVGRAGAPPRAVPAAAAGPARRLGPRPPASAGSWRDVPGCGACSAFSAAGARRLRGGGLRALVASKRHLVRWTSRRASEGGVEAGRCALGG